MRILIFNWKDITHPNAGGAEFNVHEQAKIWVKNGHAVTLYCPRYPRCVNEEIVDGVRIVRAGGRFTTYLYAPLIYLARFRNNYDILIDVENGIPFFTPLFSTKPKILIMHHVHKNVFFKELPLLIAPFPYALEQYLMPFVYRNTSIIAVSASTKHETEKLGIPSAHICIVHNGIDFTPLRTPLKKTKYPSIIYLGRMMRYKQLDILLNVFQAVQNKISNAHLSFVGSGPDLPRIKHLAHEKKLQNVTFHDFVSGTEKTRLLSQSWIYVTPSSLEGWGITVIEANACGLPAIAFDVPGLRESIQDTKTGYLVHTPQEMGNAIITLLNNKKLREKLGKNARAWSTHFSWEKTAKKTLRILEHTIHATAKS